MSQTTRRPAWWPTADQKAHADAGCAHPDECRLAPEDGDTRDPLCDQCCHAPGEHPVAVVYAYCDTKHEHEGRLITDGSVAYASGPQTDVEGIYLAEALTSTRTPANGMMLAASCGQPLPGSEDPCGGDLLWIISAEDWNGRDAGTGQPITAADRDLLVKHQAGIEDL